MIQQPILYHEQQAETTPQTSNIQHPTSNKPATKKQQLSLEKVLCRIWYGPKSTKASVANWLRALEAELGKRADSLFNREFNARKRKNKRKGKKLPAAYLRRKIGALTLLHRRFAQENGQLDNDYEDTLVDRSRLFFEYIGAKSPTVTDALMCKEAERLARYRFEEEHTPRPCRSFRDLNGARIHTMASLIPIPKMGPSVPLTSKGGSHIRGRKF